MQGHNPSDPIVGAKVLHRPTGRIGEVQMPERGASLQLRETYAEFPGAGVEPVLYSELELVEPSPYASSPSRRRSRGS
jgi:hypothetical protein